MTYRNPVSQLHLGYKTVRPAAKASLFHVDIVHGYSPSSFLKIDPDRFGKSSFLFRKGGAFLPLVEKSRGKADEAFLLP